LIHFALVTIKQENNRMKKNPSMIIGIIIVIVLVAGGYAIFHKSNKTTGTSATKSSVAPVNNAVFTTKSNASLGQYLVAANGMALYTYGGDTSGVSNVSGSLLSSWPAYQDTGSTTNLPTGVSTIKRTDNGQTQYTYNGMPLYFFSSDSAGQVTGDGVSNFSVAKPAATKATTTPATSTQPTTTTPSGSSTQPATKSSGNGY
jgi:predicted lipoprotein with Yx(FWY)xxD motif